MNSDKETEEMKIGVIGVGSVGSQHVRVYREIGADLAGVADVDFARAEEIAARFETKAYRDYEDLLNEGLDAVSVAVPTTLHRDVSLAAISHGVNVLVEKPIADSRESAAEMVAAARNAKIKLMVGQIERFNPAVQKLKEIIDLGVLGDLIILSARRVGPFVPRIVDVGIVTDLATHDIDIARYLTGKEPGSLFAKSNKVRNNRGDSALILLDFGEVAASIEVNWFTPHKVRTLVATGTRGIAYVDYIEQSIVIHDAKWKMEPKIEREEPLKAEIRHFMDCVAKGSEPLVTGEEGLKTLEVALRIEHLG